MDKYPKINTIFKRDEKGCMLVGQYSLPEFEYLKNNLWSYSEKVNGCNCRIWWKHLSDGGWRVQLGGRTGDAQIPTTLINRFQDVFPAEKFQKLYPDMEMVLCCEGFGGTIQRKGSGNYKPDGCDFVLFDILIDGWWLKRKDIEDVAKKLGIQVVPIVSEGVLAVAIQMAREGFPSAWGDFAAEGLVLKPKVELWARNGERIIAKIKHQDFERCIEL